MAPAPANSEIRDARFADQPIEQVAINTIRTLSIDAIQKANSGHPGAPMALAPVAYTLWNKVLRYDPADPAWPNRDRFVLSCGHASMLLYALLHLAGVKTKAGSNEPAVPLDGIKAFRQLDSVTPGHPEFGWTAGVETTTGPLGAGCGNSVGLAMAARWLGARYNSQDATLFDYDVYTLCSDGDLMEGVASEAASLAGHLGLANLCWIYDSNTISIEGHTDIAFTEDVAQRFKAYGWHVLHLPDANDTKAILAAFATFKTFQDKPSLIIVNSTIGYGAPTKQGTHKAHSDALGIEEIRGAKRFYGWPEDSSFLVPDEVRADFDRGIGQRGAALHAAWREAFDAFQARDPALASEIAHIIARTMPEGWESALPVFAADAEGVATREASGTVLNAIAKVCPWLVGGSADLAPSTKTWINDALAIEAAAPGGRNVHFGVREHAMGAIVNGLALSGLRAYGSTFLVFSDYMRPPVRLAALMDLPAFHVFTHDSIGVGEDGPTHQPVEHLAGLRAIPGLITIRPADANEVVSAYRAILNQSHRPAALVLSRQALPTLDRTVFAAAQVEKGAYILADAPEGQTPAVILIASGSEVQLCVSVWEALKAEGIKARVVSMPCWELFEEQDEAYRDHVLPPAVAARVCVEQAAVLGWDRYAGATGTIIGMRGFGASAPLKDLLEKFGFTPAKVLAAARAQIERHKS